MRKSVSPKWRELSKIWAERASQQGEYENARTFYQRYLFLIPDDKQVLKLLEQIDTLEQQRKGLYKFGDCAATPTTWSPQAIAAMVQKYGFHHPADWSKYELSPSITGNMRHDYKVIDVQGVQVIIDHATNLMWQQNRN